MKALKFIILVGSFSIHKLKPGTTIPKTVFASPFYSVSKTDEEISIVAPENIKIKAEKSEPGWSVLKVAGPLEFSLTGILAEIAATLAQAGISIFSLSTYNTDYILVKSENLNPAREALIAAGHNFVPTTMLDTKKS